MGMSSLAVMGNSLLLRTHAARPLVVQQLGLDILEAQQLDMREQCEVYWQQIAKHLHGVMQTAVSHVRKKLIGSR